MSVRNSIDASIHFCSNTKASITRLRGKIFHFFFFYLPQLQTPNAIRQNPDPRQHIPKQSLQNQNHKVQQTHHPSAVKTALSTGDPLNNTSSNKARSNASSACRSHSSVCCILLTSSKQTLNSFVNTLG
jgi:hypothetical protein